MFTGVVAPGPRPFYGRVPCPPLAETDNLPRWGGRPGGFEAWHLTLTEPVSGRGVWIRAGSSRPVRPPWGMAALSAFHPASPERTFGIQERHPATRSPSVARPATCEPETSRSARGSSWDRRRRRPGRAVDLTFPTGASRPVAARPGDQGPLGARGVHRPRTRTCRSRGRWPSTATSWRWTTCPAADAHLRAPAPGAVGVGQMRGVRGRGRDLRGVHRPDAPRPVPDAVPHHRRPCVGAEVDAVHPASVAARFLLGVLAHRRRRPAIPADGPRRGSGPRDGSCASRGSRRHRPVHAPHVDGLVSPGAFERRPGGFDEVAVLESHGRCTRSGPAGRRRPPSNARRSSARRPAGDRPSRPAAADLLAAEGHGWGIAIFPLFAAAVAAVFAVSLARRFIPRRRPAMGLWTIALAMFAAASLAMFLGVIDGWSGAEYRVYWLFGAILNVPYLAMGEVYLLSADEWWRTRCSSCCSWVRRSRPGRWRRRPSRRRRSRRRCRWERTCSATGSAPYRISQLYAFPAYFLLLGGVIWSSWRMRGRPELRNQTGGAIVIAVGATIVPSARGWGRDSTSCPSSR